MAMQGRKKGTRKKSTKKSGSKGSGSGASAGSGAMNFTGKIRVDQNARVTILDRAVRKRAYELKAAGKTIKVVIRHPSSPALLGDSIPPNGVSPDSCCPC